MSATVLHSSVTDVLGQRITAGHLPAGSTLTLDGIGTEFGVSRTVTRETMRQLEALGLVRSGRRIGLVVLPEQDWNVYDAPSGRGRALRAGAWSRGSRCARHRTRFRSRRGSTCCPQGGDLR